MYRSKSATDEVGPLETLELPRSGPMRWLWNPGSRRHKALFDLADGLQRLAEKLSENVAGPESRSDFPDVLQLTEPYLALLNLASDEVDRSSAGFVQFGIIQSAWPDREDLLFLSRWHAVESSAA